MSLKGLKVPAIISFSVPGKFIIAVLILNSPNDSNHRQTWSQESPGEAALRPDFSFGYSGRGLNALLRKWLRLTLRVNAACTSAQRKTCRSLMPWVSANVPENATHLANKSVVHHGVLLCHFRRFVSSVSDIMGCGSGSRVLCVESPSELASNVPSIHAADITFL